MALCYSDFKSKRDVVRQEPKYGNGESGHYHVFIIS